ncbi:MAG: DUF6622 family protein [Pseudomonadota bacterium]
MLEQIITRTPIWVWALLAFLIYRGVIASIDREVVFKKLFIIPLLMMALSIQGIVNTFGAHLMAPVIWFSAAALGGWITWKLVKSDDITPRPATGTVFQPGSWTPLAIMMGIFLTKYIVSITLSMHPALAQNMQFVCTVCGLYGVFNGILLGKLLRTVALYRDAAHPAYAV